MKITDSSIIVDKEIIELVKSINLIAPFDPNLLSGCSYDIRAGSKIISRNRTSEFNLDKEPYVIESGECVTVLSLEEFSFRDKPLFGILVNKHSLLGQGLFHPITTVDPGYTGKLSITFLHLGHVPFKISKGDAICNIYFHYLSQIPDRWYGTTQTPNIKEGNTDYALVIKEPDEELRKKSLKFTFGKPFTDLTEKVESLEKKFDKIKGESELIYYKKQDEKKKDNVLKNRFLITIIVALCSFIFGSILFGGLGLLKDYFVNHSDKSQTDPKSQQIDTIK